MPKSLFYHTGIMYLLSQWQDLKQVSSSHCHLLSLPSIPQDTCYSFIHRLKEYGHHSLSDVYISARADPSM